MPCAKFYSDPITTALMTAEWNFHQIWITMQNSSLNGSNVPITSSWMVWVKRSEPNHNEPQPNTNRVHISWDHYGDVIMGAIASQITRLIIVYSTVYSDAGQRKHQSSASLAIVWGIHRGPVNSPHKWPVTRKMFPFDDVIMYISCATQLSGQLFGLWNRLPNSSQ